MSNATRAYERVQVAVASGRNAGVAALLCACLAVLAAGCTTMQPLERETAAREIEPGETVLVTTHDGRELELFFDDWTSEALTGTDELGIAQKVENEDIARVEVKRFAPMKSAGLVVGGLVVVAVVGVASLADELDY